MDAQFQTPEDFGRTVHILSEGQVSEMTLEAACLKYASGFSVDGCELLFTQNGNSRLIESFRTEAEARHALLLSLKWELQYGEDMPEFFRSREAAEACADSDA